MHKELDRNVLQSRNSAKYGTVVCKENVQLATGRAVNFFALAFPKRETPTT